MSSTTSPDPTAAPAPAPPPPAPPPPGPVGAAPALDPAIDGVVSATQSDANPLVAGALVVTDIVNSLPTIATTLGTALRARTALLKFILPFGGKYAMSRRDTRVSIESKTVGLMQEIMSDTAAYIQEHAGEPGVPTSVAAVFPKLSSATPCEKHRRK